MYKRMYFILFNAITDALDCENKEKTDEMYAAMAAKRAADK